MYINDYFYVNSSGGGGKFNGSVYGSAGLSSLRLKGKTLDCTSHKFISGVKLNNSTEQVELKVGDSGTYYIKGTATTSAGFSVDLSKCYIMLIFFIFFQFC